MTTLAKASIVCGMYLVALGFASAVVATRLAFDDPAQASGGMSAFGDVLLFGAAFTAGALPATALALYYLRPVDSFWRVLSVAAVASSVTGVVAGATFVAQRFVGPGSPVLAWSALAVLRVLAAPALGSVDLLSCMFAPKRSYRVALGWAMVGEVVAFGAIGAMLLISIWRERGPF